ncbi:translocase of chloroplast 159, chloroplastic [Tanacetum coccineum]
MFDTPGFKSSIMEQGYNRSVLASAKKFTKKNPLDIVLYVDRLDAQTRDHNGFPLLKTITTSLGPAIWKSVIVTLTHGTSAPPEGSNGLTLSYEMFVTQRSHIVQQAISQAVGDMRMMSPSLMNPVSLVENHQSCLYPKKTISRVGRIGMVKRFFGMSRPHPKLLNDQDGTESDAYLADLTESDNEEDDDEYDQLPSFKPLKISQVSMLRKELKKAYFNEYVYRVKLLQKKQWKKSETNERDEAVKRLEGNDGAEAEYKMLPGGHTNYDPDTSMCSVPIVKDATDVAIATVMSGIQVRIYYSLWFGILQGLNKQATAEIFGRIKFTIGREVTQFNCLMVKAWKCTNAINREGVGLESESGGRTTRERTIEVRHHLVIRDNVKEVMFYG